MRYPVCSMMIKMLLKSLILLLATLPAFSLPITTSNFCSAGVVSGVLSESTANPCYVTGFVPGPPTASNGPQFASANSTSSLAISAKTFTVQLSAFAFASPYAFGSASVEFSDVFLSDGPVRPGQVRGTFSGGTSGTGGGNGGFGSTFPGKKYDTFGELAPPMYITLGQLFPVYSFAKASISGDPGQANSRLFGSYLSLSFFEADGVTPVSISEVPEPSTYALVVLAFTGCFLRTQPRDGSGLPPRSLLLRRCRVLR